MPLVSGVMTGISIGGAVMGLMSGKRGGAPPLHFAYMKKGTGVIGQVAQQLAQRTTQTPGTLQSGLPGGSITQQTSKGCLITEVFT